jgi:hypothetical protein
MMELMNLGNPGREYLLGSLRDSADFGRELAIRVAQQ